MNELDRKNALYLEACALMNAKDYESALIKFEELGSWLDSKEKVAQCQNRIDNPIEETTEKDNKPINLEKHNHMDSKTKKILLGALCGLIVIVLAIVLIFVLPEKDNNTPNSNNTPSSNYTSSGDKTTQPSQDEIKSGYSIENSSLQANLSSWGMACTVRDDIYYSDMKTGIYINNDHTQFISGIYSDLCFLDDKLVCIEYYDVQESETNSSQYGRLVLFDIQTKEKTIAFTTPTGDDYLMVSNVIDDKIYFSLTENALFICDSDGKVTDTGIRNVRKVTESGIFTAQYSESGLRIVSFDNREIMSYNQLLKYNVVVYFELNEKLYAKISDDDNETWTFVTIDITSGSFKPINNQNTFGEMTNVNFKDNKLYCTFVNVENNSPICSVYKAELDGTNMEYVTSIRNNEVNTTLNLICVFDDCLYVSFPYSGVDSEFIKIK